MSDQGGWLRWLWGFYQRWQGIREAAFALKVAKAEASMKGYRVAGAVATPLCSEMVFHDRDCRCGGMAPAACGNRLTKRRFLWVGRCADCSTKQKALAKRSR